jgi:hypothetical protein
MDLAPFPSTSVDRDGCRGFVGPFPSTPLDAYGYVDPAGYKALRQIQGRCRIERWAGATILPRVVWVAQHAVLGLAALALGAAALRAASLTGATGLERIVAAAPVAAAIACAESLLLGAVRLGSSPVALALAAVLTWLASLWLPSRGPSVGAELSWGWAARDRGQRAVAGAAAGSFLALCAWLLKYPYVGNDGVTYHLNTVVDFVESGRPTDLVTSTYAFPTANHPLTNELLLSWPISIARSFVSATLWTPVALLIAGLAAWVGLRSLEVPPGVRALAVAALCTLPLNLEHLGEPNSDTPALTWLLCAAALTAGVRRRPALLVPALLTGGLALGTKTTVLWPLLVALGLGAYLARGRLQELRLPLWLAFAGAVVVGGYWYARNTIDHGFPLWPFLETPWSDPLPRLLELFSHTFLDRPQATLEGRVDDYVETLAGVGLGPAPRCRRPHPGRRARAVVCGDGPSRRHRASRLHPDPLRAAGRRPPEAQSRPGPGARTVRACPQPRMGRLRGGVHAPRPRATRRAVSGDRPRRALPLQGPPRLQEPALPRVRTRSRGGDVLACSKARWAL